VTRSPQPLELPRRERAERPRDTVSQAPSLVEDEGSFTGPAADARVVVLACGAIAREVLAVIELNGWTHVDVRCLPAKLHSTPERIPATVDAKLTELEDRYERVFVAYADCGTAGGLDHVLNRHEVERLPGAHCYGFLAGNDAWEAMQEEEPATFYLTDFLARHFDALVVRALKLDVHPELLPLVFGNYRRLVYLAQTDDRELDRKAETAAAFLGLEYERRRTGYGELVPSLTRFAAGAARA
jgi:Protein of unknown function (DUF1638)